MSAKKPEGNDPSILGLFAVGLVILSWSLWQKTAVARYVFWKSHGGQIKAIAVLLIVLAIVLIAATLYNWYIGLCFENAITEKDDTAVYLGKGEDAKDVYLKQVFRTTHTLLTGTTSAGKSQSVVLPWAIHDIEQGNGLLILDGKSDSGFLDKLYAHVLKAGRADDFRFFSLANLAASGSFNPLAGGGAQEVAERVFSSFPFENEYYRNVQYKVFLGLLSLIHERDRVPTFVLVERLLNDHDLLKCWLQDCENTSLKRQLTKFNEMPEREKCEKISGLDSYMTHFSGGETAILYNAMKPHIDLEEALSKNQICYFQLPTMYNPFLAEMTGKLVLQSFQAAVSKRHLGLTQNPRFFSCYLDDFQDYIYEKFAALLNKSRSANVGVVFSHQALGDLDKVSTAFRNVVLSCTNVKIVMRTTEPDTCDYFARGFGTVKSEKTTERKSHEVLGDGRTGEGSVREVNEFRYHPDVIKNLPVGHGIVTIPHSKGVKTIKISFAMRPDLPSLPLPNIKKEPIHHEDDPPPPEPEQPVNSSVT